MQKIFKILVFLTSLESLLAIEQLISEEFTSKTFTVADITGWSQKSVHVCPLNSQTSVYTDYGGNSMFGIFGKTFSNPVKTYSNLPPHWSVSVRFDMLLYQSMDSEDYVTFQFDSLPVEKYVKTSAHDFARFCGTDYADFLIFYDRNLTHTASSLTFNIHSIMSEVESNEGFLLKNLFVYVDTCHQSCETCNGPRQDQCQTCPLNATKLGNTCSCNPNYYSHLYKCVSSCPTGFTVDSTNKICVIDFCAVADCTTCVNKICTVCASGKKLLSGQCISSCPNYAPETAGVCKDMSDSLTNGKYLLKGLYSNSFGQSEVLGLGLTTSGFLGYRTQSSGAKVTKCGSKNLLGGAYLSGQGAYIQKDFTGIAPHSSITVGYTFYKIDTWDKENAIMYIDNVQKNIVLKDYNDGTSNLCGGTYNEDAFQISQNIIHTATTMSLKITTSLDSDPFDESFGIREIFVLVDYCSLNCQSCNAAGCLTCSSGFYLYQKSCFQVCPEGSYVSSSTTCTTCDLTCQTCSAAGNKSCTKCKSGTYLNPDKSCLSTCPAKFWQRTSDLTCQSCDISCYNCNSPGDGSSCTACSDSLYLFNNQCGSNCPSTHVKVVVPNNNTCQKCENTCLTCDGVNNNNCLTCQGPSYFLQPAFKTCVTSCNTKQYQNKSNQQCSDCETTCATCSGGLSDNCLTCSGTLFFDSTTKKCVPNCPDTFYNNPGDNKCIGCESTCATCNGGGASSCLTCNLSRYFQSGTKQCVTQCNSNQYKDDATKSCKICDNSCSTCSGGNDNNCLTCTGDLYLDKSTNKCVPSSSCPSGYYANISNHECTKCENSCATCDGGSSSNCLSCILPKYYQQSAKQCVNQCNPGQYQDGPSASCKSCNPSCATCNGGSGSDCQSCSGNTYLDPFAAKCIPNCPNNYYPEKSNNKCTKCDNTCATCDAGSSSNCLSCILPKYYQQSSKQCVSQCNPGQYQDDPSATCKSCNSQCATCKGGSDSNCLSCTGNLFLDPNAAKCISTCPNNYYPEKSNNKCIKCESTCATCDGGLSSNCLSCILPKYYQQSTKQCVSTCNSNQYKDDGTASCKTCNPNCTSCKGGSAADCLSCSGSSFLDPFATKCIPTCPNNFYPNKSNNTCTQCESTCATCDEGSSSNCLSCNLPRYYQQSTKQCVTKCNADQYQEDYSKSCQKCDDSCQTCSGPQKSDCLTCSGSLFLDPFTKNCISSCPNNYYPNKSDNKCTICNQTCATCDGGSDSDCLKCSGNRYFQLSTKQCVLNCNSDQYNDISSHECVSCNPSCATCDGKGDNQCLSCQGSQFLDKITKQCVKTCPDGQYANKSDNTCTECDNNCKTCDNGSSKDCLQCSGTKHFFSETKECLEKCPEPYYSDSVNNLCSKCNDSCSSCTSNEICTTCKEGYFLEDNNCNQECKDGFYGDETTKSCQKCNSKCKTCFGPSETDCDECADSQLTSLDGTCIFDCPYQIYHMNTYPYKKCIKCHYKCRTGCSGTREEDCNTIKVQYQIIFYILLFKSGLWVLSFVWGIFKDRHVEKNTTVKPINPNEIDDKNQDVSQISPTRVSKKESIFEEESLKKVGTLNYLDNFSKQVTMTNLNQTNLTFAEPTSRKRRMRAKFIRDTITPTNHQPSPDSSPKKASSPQVDLSQQSFSSPESPIRKKYNTITSRNTMMMSSIFSLQDNEIVESNQKLKYTIIGNEWISLFKLNDPNISRPIRTTLIYLKYQAFFFATQFIYEYTIKYIALCLLFGLAVKFILSKGLQFTGYSQSIVGNIAVNFAFFGLLFCHFFFWFVPQLLKLFIAKDVQWSIFYSVIFSADLLIFQQIFSFLEYLITIKYLNHKNDDDLLSDFYTFFKSDLLIKYIKK